MAEIISYHFEGKVPIFANATLNKSLLGNWTVTSHFGLILPDERIVPFTSIAFFRSRSETNQTLTILLECGCDGLSDYLREILLWKNKRLIAICDSSHIYSEKSAFLAQLPYDERYRKMVATFTSN